MKNFSTEITQWLDGRTDAEGAQAVGIGRSTITAYRLGTREPNPLALPELRLRMAANKISSGKRARGKAK